MNDVEHEPDQSLYLPLPFAVRWESALDRAMRQGGWHCFIAPPQSGKTMSNRHKAVTERAQKTSDGRTEMRVGIGWSANHKPLVLRSLARDIGGPRFAMLAGRELSVADMIRKVLMRLIIINNAHNLDATQWQELLTLDDVTLGSPGGIRPAIVLSSAYAELPLASLARRPDLLGQVQKRLRNPTYIPGHDRDEVKEGLRLILERDAPELIRDRPHDHASLIFNLLTEPVFLVDGVKAVSSVDLYEFSRRLVAYRRKHRDESIAECVRAAAARLKKEQLTLVKSKQERIAKAQAATEAA